MAILKPSDPLVVAARTAGMGATTGAPTAARHSLTHAPIAPAERGKHAQPARGVYAASLGAGDLVVGLAHGAALFKLDFTVGTIVLIDRHLSFPQQSSFAAQRTDEPKRSYFTPFARFGQSGMGHYTPTARQRRRWHRR